MSGDLTLDELNTIANELCRKHWGVDFTGKVVLTNRNWKRRLGCYVPDGKLIRMSRKANGRRTKSDVEYVLVHELVHWRLHTTGQPYDDADPEFITECLRVGAPLSPTSEVRRVYAKIFGEELTLIDDRHT